MSSTPVLSIITPVFNNVGYIKECIQNVIDQQCQVVEHIIVDGGSSDGTVEIIEQHAQQYNHIRWISEQDRGQSDAMNKGIKMADGQFISFLNVDDYYEVGALTQVANYIVSHNLTVPTMLLGRLRQTYDYRDDEHIRKPNPVTPEYVLKFWERESYPANPVSYFYHKELHNLIGYYDESQHYTMDYDFFIRVAIYRVNVVYFDDIWGTYRMIYGAKTVEMGQRGGTKHLKEELFHRYIEKLSCWLRCSIYWQYFTKYKIKYFIQALKDKLDLLKVKYFINR